MTGIYSNIPFSVLDFYKREGQPDFYVFAKPLYLIITLV